MRRASQSQREEGQPAFGGFAPLRDLVALTVCCDTVINGKYSTTASRLHTIQLYAELVHTRIDGGHISSHRSAADRSWPSTLPAYAKFYSCIGLSTAWQVDQAHACWANSRRFSRIKSRLRFGTASPDWTVICKGPH